MLVNGIEESWASGVFTIGNVIVTGIDEIEYNDKREKTNNYGAGAEPVSRSYGKYEAESSITLHQSEVEALQKIAPNGDITLLGMFDVTVTFPNSGVRHKIRGCEFTENMRTMKKDDPYFPVKLPMIITKIEWK